MIEQLAYKAVVIGVSSGGLSALKKLLPGLEAGFSMAILVVQHLSADSDSTWISWLDQMSRVTVKEADEKEPILAGHVYIAPPNYHLLVEEDHSLSLSSDEKVNYARPAIDVLFESAAIAYGKELIGVVLTGSSSDGTRGMITIRDHGGLTLVQDPAEAESRYMPASVIAAMKPDHVLTLEKIIHLLNRINTLSKDHRV